MVAVQPAAGGGRGRSGAARDAGRRAALGRRRRRADHCCRCSCFGLLASASRRGWPVASAWRRCCVGTMLGLAAGAAGRARSTAPAALFAGTVVVGGAIAVANVLLPPLIKRDFPNRTGAMMGLYTMAVSGAAAARPPGSPCRWPTVAAAGGWRGALGVWAVPAAVTALIWLPRLRPRSARRRPRHRRGDRCCAVRWPGS